MGRQEPGRRPSHAQKRPGQKQGRQPPQKRGLSRLFSSAEMLLVKKDMAGIWARSSQRALLMLLPVTLVVVIPAVYFVAISLLPAEPGAQLTEAIVALLSGTAEKLDYRQGWLIAFTDLLCPLLFLCVPILTAAASASYAFVTEREGGTLETLLLTTMDVKNVFNAKVTNCTILSVVISGAAFVAFAITAIIAEVFAGVRPFFSWDWLVILVMLTPVLSLFSVVFVAMIITRVHSTGESLQTMGYLILPVAAAYLAQFTGIFRLNFWILGLAALVLGAAAVVLFNMASRGFTAEKLLADEEREAG